MNKNFLVKAIALAVVMMVTGFIMAGVGMVALLGEPNEIRLASFLLVKAAGLAVMPVGFSILDKGWKIFFCACKALK